MLEIKIQKLVVPKEFIKYLSLAWNGNIEIHISDPTKGKHQEQFQDWINLCAMYDKHKINDIIRIGNHEFDEDRFEFSCGEISSVIQNKEEGKIPIVLIPRNGKALEIKIENLIIPKEFIEIIKFRENRIQIRTSQPDLEIKTHEKLKEMIAIGGVIEKKQVIDAIKIGNHLLKQKFRFGCKPKLGIVGISKGSFEVTLTLVDDS